jgi:hypothetical protein
MTREEASYILRKFYADGYKSNNYNTLEQALQLAVMCLENLPHWISVEDEELPKPGEMVLAFKPDDTFQFTTTFFTSIDVWKKLDITHWMHLSPPPIIISSKKGD